MALASPHRSEPDLVAHPPNFRNAVGLAIDGKKPSFMKISYNICSCMLSPMIMLPRKAPTRLPHCDLSEAGGRRSSWAPVKTSMWHSISCSSAAWAAGILRGGMKGEIPCMAQHDFKATPHDLWSGVVRRRDLAPGNRCGELPARHEGRCYPLSIF